MPRPSIAQWMGKNQFSRVSPDLLHKLGVVVLLGLMAIRLVTSMLTINPTIDEPVHVVSGYSYLVTGDFRLNTEHPPLFKLIATLPLLALNLDFPLENASWKEAHQWELGDIFVFHNRVPADTIIFWARLPMVGITLALGAAIYFWSRKLFGREAGLFSLFLYSFDPNIIAHGQLVTNDILFSLGALVATVACIEYLKKPSKKNLFFVSVAIGFVLLTKFSALFLLPAFVLLGYVAFVVKRKKVSWKFVKKLIAHVLIGTVVVAALIILSYGFELKRAVDDPTFAPGLNSLIVIDHGAGKMIYTVFERVPIPAFSYFKGITDVARHNKYGHDSYLLGDYRTHGWWYYFPVAILVKTPLSVFMLGIMAVVFVLKKKIRVDANRLDAITLFGFVIPPLLHLAASMSGKINLGLRHVIIIYPFMYLLLGALMRVRLDSKTHAGWYRFGLAASGIYLVVTTSLIFPHYLSYFNEASGGPTQGWRYLLDSNLDWGQDMKNLGIWMKKHEVSSVYLQYSGTTPPETYNITTAHLPKTNELAQVNEELHGYGIISLNALFNKDDEFSWLKKSEPIDRIGYSMWVYDLDKLPRSEE